MGRLARQGDVEKGAGIFITRILALVGVVAGCVGDPPVFEEPDASTPASDAGHDGEASEDIGTSSDGGHDGPGGDAGEAGGARCDPSAPFTEIEPIAELNAASDEEAARLTPDELVMYFTRRAGAGQPFQIYTAKRGSRDAPFGPATPILLLANASGAMLSPDGMTLYYSSDRGGSDPNAHLYMARLPFSAATSVALTALNSTALDYSPYVSADDDELYFVSRRPADVDDNIFFARREADDFVEPTAVAGVNSNFAERAPVVSADGLRLYVGSNRSNGANDFGIYVSARASRTETYGEAVAVTELNTPSVEMPDWIAADDCTLYFRSDRPGGPGGRDLWRARRR